MKRSCHPTMTWLPYRRQNQNLGPIKRNPGMVLLPIFLEIACKYTVICMLYMYFIFLLCTSGRRALLFNYWSSLLFLSYFIFILWLIHTLSFEGVDPLDYEKQIRLDQFVVRKALRFIVVPLKSSAGTYCTLVFL